MLLRLLTSADPLAFEPAKVGSRTSDLRTRYERQKDLGLEAVVFHGLECADCGSDFEKAYGEYLRGFLHVHHVLPTSAYGGEKL